MRADERLARIAERQFGVFSLEQAIRSGLSIDQAKYRLRTHQWSCLHRAVYLVAGAPLSSEGRILAGTLAGGEGTCASHTSAALLFKMSIPKSDDPPVHITVPGRRGPSIAGLSIHRPRILPRSDLGRIGPIRVTTPNRTLLDLAAVLDELALEETLDEALRRGLVRVAVLRRRLEEARGLPGVAALRSLVLDRTTAPTESPLETRFLRLLRAARLPLPVPQYAIRVNGRVVARVDFAYVKERLAIELDGYAYHSGKQRFDAGHERDQQIIDADWFVLHFSDKQVKSGADRVVTTVRRTLARRSGSS